MNKTQNGLKLASSCGTVLLLIPLLIICLVAIVILVAPLFTH